METLTLKPTAALDHTLVMYYYPLDPNSAVKLPQHGSPIIPPYVFLDYFFGTRTSIFLLGYKAESTVFSHHKQQHIKCFGHIQVNYEQNTVH